MKLLAKLQHLWESPERVDTESDYYKVTSMFSNNTLLRCYTPKDLVKNVRPDDVNGFIEVSDIVVNMGTKKEIEQSKLRVLKGTNIKAFIELNEYIEEVMPGEAQITERVLLKNRWGQRGPFWTLDISHKVPREDVTMLLLGYGELLA